MMRIISVVHALQLCHIDLLREMPIEKCIIYIKLAKSPLAIEGNAKNIDNDGIYHRTESHMKVNAQLLVKAFNNKVSFILCNRAVRILFDAKHPFVAHYILPLVSGEPKPEYCFG